MPPEKKDDKTQQDPNASLEGLHKAFGDMSKQFQALPNQISQAVTQGINAAVQQQNAAVAKQEPPKKEEVPQVTSDDLEKMSRAEFAQHITKIISGAVDEKLKPIQEGLSTNVEDIQRERVRERFEAVKNSHPDFDKWQGEIRGLLETHGYLDPEDLYTLARAKNPDKAKEIDQELQQAKKDEEDDTKKPEDSGTKFLGLMPTNSSAVEESDKEPKFKSSKDAAEAAFDEVMKDIPGNFFGDASQV